MMSFRVVSTPSNNHVRCPYRIVEQATGREIDWINQYLDYEMLRRLADTTLRTYAHELLHFLRWWESVHHTDAVTKDALTATTLLDYVRFQSGQERELTGATINQRVAIVDRALRIAFPDAPLQTAPALQSIRQTKHIFSSARLFDGVGVWTTKNNDQGGGEAVKKPTVWQSNVKRAVSAKGNSASSAACR